MKTKIRVRTYLTFVTYVILAALVALCGSVCKQTYANTEALGELTTVTMDKGERTNEGEAQMPTPKAGSIQLNQNQGKVFICDQTTALAIPLDVGNGLTPLVITLPCGEYSIAYDKNAGYLAVEFLDGNTIIFSQQPISFEQNCTNTDVSVYRLKTDNGDDCIFGTSAVIENTKVIAFCQTNGQDKEYIQTFIKQSLQSLTKWDYQLDISICGLVLNKSWFSSEFTLQIVDSICHIEKGEDAVVNISLSLIEANHMVLPNKFISANSDIFLYGNFMEADSNLQPFLYETDDGQTIKIVSSLETLQEVFPK